MKRGLTILALTALAVVVLSSVALTGPSPVLADGGATQISGVGLPDPNDTCNAGSQSADYANIMTGDLEGCLYSFVETSVGSPSGTYRETGREIFVGEYNGQTGTFETTYRFEAKFEDPNDPTTEIFGRCQHPIVAESGTGVFEGVTGRLDFKDVIVPGNPSATTYPYRGHLRW